MIAVPREVISIQSPWRQIARVHLEVAGAVARAVVVAPEEDRHRRHRLGDDELADLVDHGVAVLVEGLDLGAQRAALELALVDGEDRDSADERGADVGAAAGREEPGVLADVLVDPVEALGGERRAGRADGAEAGEVAARARLDAVLHAGGDIGGAGAEAGHAGPLGEVPEDAHVRVAGVAVVEDDRGRREQDRRPGSSTSSSRSCVNQKKRSPVCASRWRIALLQLLHEDPAVSVDDRLRQPGRAGGVEDPEGVVEGHPLEGELGALPELRAAVPRSSARRP